MAASRPRRAVGRVSAGWRLLWLGLTAVVGCRPAPRNSVVPGVPHFKLTYATRAADVRRWLKDNRHQQMLGFDTETKPSFVKGRSPNPPSTLQLSTQDSVLIVQLTCLQRELSDLRRLLPVLADPAVIKAGVAIDDDAIELWQHYGIDVCSRLELGGVGGGPDTRSLQRLAKGWLGFELPKSRRMTMSDWTAEPLSAEQQRYAALDAWAGFAIWEAVAAQAPELFAHEVLMGLLVDELPLPELYARRLVRKALRRELIAIEKQLAREGLPHLRLGSEAVRTKQTRSVEKSVARSRQRVLAMFAANSLRSFDVEPKKKRRRHQ